MAKRRRRRRRASLGEQIGNSLPWLFLFVGLLCSVPLLFAVSVRLLRGMSFDSVFDALPQIHMKLLILLPVVGFFAYVGYGLWKRLWKD